MNNPINLYIPYNGMYWASVPTYIEDEEGSWYILFSQAGYTSLPVSLVKVGSSFSFDEIFEECLDISRTILEEDVHEAYARIIDGEEVNYENKEQFDTAIDEYYEPVLKPGYYYQANFTGTGIVELGEDWRLIPYDHKKEKQLYKNRFK